MFNSIICTIIIGEVIKHTNTSSWLQMIYIALFHKPFIGYYRPILCMNSHFDIFHRMNKTLTIKIHWRLTINDIFEQTRFVCVWDI